MSFRGPVDKHNSPGHSADPCACHYRCPWVPVGSHLPVPGEKLSPIHLPFLPVYTRAVGEGPSSQELYADAVQNIGFNELQNEEAAADTYGCCSHPPPAQHVPSSTRRILLQTLSSCFSRMPLHGVHPWYGLGSQAQHLPFPGSTGGYQWRAGTHISLVQF